MEKMSDNHVKKILPIGVKIISVLIILTGLLSAITSILFMVGVGKFLENIPGTLSFVLGGSIMFLIAGALISFVGVMLWKGKNWAREVIILFAVLGTVGGITTMIRGDYYGVIDLIINGAIGGYLWFSTSVKQAFKK